MEHVPVLAGSALEFLRIRENGVYVDCTAGAGGHSALIAQRLGERGMLIAIDRDPSAVALTRERLSAYPQAVVLQGNYGALSEILAAHHVSHVDGLLIDAGVSSMQLDQSERGFSFQEAGPLDMRMDPGTGPTAAEYLGQVEEGELARVLHDYGDLRRAKSIARAICSARDRAALSTTQDLAEVVAKVFDFVHGVPQETRTVFQAIRIAVNEELRWLEAGLQQGIDFLAKNGRIVCITFHSGEDRIVKNTLKAAARSREVLHPDGRVRETLPARLKLLTPKPVRPEQEEIRANSRAQSAKLRAAEKLA